MIDPLQIKYLVHKNRVKESGIKVNEIQCLLAKAIAIHYQNCRDFAAVEKEMEVENLCKEIQESMK